ncbi:2-oxoisovalerate dehydrogenase E2 component (dihydrolipoyl transacylase) [Strigomonas culicis]|uniref:2-oxoisovalerate dehydrogenase E2 component (Dihydrolipoyl transacylase) n=1 Tax=Strigomonas culicis TaxID=28005 RepID=S9UQY5_9TRYP|nr:2-oxoisovalerate dehydrogenase E2 component (dihydrolipoyl transacylase) [Strigomonas culicis]EPY31174.1 2-oxoisovalerate dehydrogenase E2 component (dihydrolipoyl transacylase) [Strigomonas culicis]|eukprot:EPY26216.1 2-oxoisovalerate dehydrogenase E2 component (dihydrolipoyl transacylase) [Strigomonas culicis]
MTASEAAAVAAAPPSSPAASPAAAAPAPAAAPASADKILATPATRYLAKEHDVDLRLVPATGKGGRITKEDLLRYVAERQQQAAASAVATRPASDLAAVTPSASALLQRPLVEDQVIPLVGVRRGMVKSMTQAASIPTFSCTEEYDLTKLITLRATLKERVARRTKGVLKLSITPFFVKAASAALRDFPDINALVTDPACASFVRKGAHNIGFAMDTPTGLIVPVIKNVEQKSILQIAQDMQTFIERGRQGRVSLEDLSGGTFTLSNIGTIGSTVATPVVMPPQVAIGAIGRLQKLPRYNARGELYQANLVTITFSADHRIIDGATMVRFAVTLKDYLENPGELLLDLQ